MPPPYSDGDLTEEEKLFLGKPKAPDYSGDSEDDLTDVERLFLPKAPKAPSTGFTISGGSWWTPERVKSAVSYLQSNAKLSSAGAHGLVARWAAVEAGAGPDSVNPNSGAKGIAQWLGGREKGLPKDFEGQLRHAVKELNTTESRAAERLRKARTPEEAAIGAAMYERAEGYDPKTGRDNFVNKTIKAMKATGAPVDPGLTDVEKQFSGEDLTDVEKMFLGGKDTPKIPTDPKGKPLVKPPPTTPDRPLQPDVQTDVQGEPPPAEDWAPDQFFPWVEQPKKKTTKLKDKRRFSTDVTLLPDEEDTQIEAPQTEAPQPKRLQVREKFTIDPSWSDEEKAKAGFSTLVGKELVVGNSVTQQDVEDYINDVKASGGQLWRTGNPSATEANLYQDSVDDFRAYLQQKYRTPEVMAEELKQRVIAPPTDEEYRQRAIDELTKERMATGLNRFDRDAEESPSIQNLNLSEQEIADKIAEYRSQDEILDQATRSAAYDVAQKNAGIPGAALSGLYGGTGSIYHTLAGIVRPFNTRAYKTLQGIGTELQSVSGYRNQGQGSANTGESIAGFAGELAPGLLELSVLPGGPVGKFAFLGAAKASGAGKNITDITKQGLEGGLTGKAFGIASELKNPIARLGTVFGGSMVAGTVVGVPLEENLHRSLMNTAFEVHSTFGPKALNKFYRFWKGGEPFDILIDLNGNVKQYKPDPSRQITGGEVILDPTPEIKSAVVEAKNAVDNKSEETKPDLENFSLPQESPFKAEEIVSTPDGPGKVIANHLSEDGSVFVELEGNKGIALFKPEVLSPSSNIKPWGERETNMIHGTSRDNSESILASGRFDPASGNRQYPYSQLAPDATYIAPEGSMWYTDPYSGRMVPYDTQLGVEVNPAARTFTVNSTEDLTTLARIAGFENVKDFLDEWTTDFLPERGYGDHEQTKRAIEISNKLRAAGIDIVEFPASENVAYDNTESVFGKKYEEFNRDDASREEFLQLLADPYVQTGKPSDWDRRTVPGPQSVVLNPEVIKPRSSSNEISEPSAPMVENEAVRPAETAASETQVERGPDRRTNLLGREDYEGNRRRDEDRRRAAELAKNTTPETVRNLASDKGFDPESAEFKDAAEQLTGKRTLADMEPAELATMRDALYEGEFKVAEPTAVSEPEVPAAAEQPVVDPSADSLERSSVDEVPAKPLKPTGVDKNGQPKSVIHVKGENGEYPVHRVTINGEDRYIQRMDTQDIGTNWHEVVPDGKGSYYPKSWNDPEASQMDRLLSNNLGSTKAEAISALQSKPETLETKPIESTPFSEPTKAEDSEFDNDYEVGNPVTLRDGAEGMISKVNGDRVDVITHDGRELKNIKASSLRSEAGFIDVSFMQEPVRKITERIRKAIQDTVSPLTHLAKAGVGMPAIVHAYSRISVPDTVNNFLSTIFPDSYLLPSEMAKTIRIINLDNILDGYYTYRQRSQDALKTAAGFTRRSTDERAKSMAEAAKWHQKAEAIDQKYPIKDLITELLAAKDDPKIMENIDRWNQTINPLMDKLYRKVKGLAEDEDLPARGHFFKARINLLPDFKEEAMKQFGDLSTPMPGGSYSNYKEPFGSRDQYDRAASFTGDYSTDAQAVLTNVYGPRWTMATRLNLFQALIDSGNAVLGDKPNFKINGREPVFMKIALPESTGQNNRTKLVNQALWVDPKLVVPLRRVLNTDIRAQQQLKYSFFNAFQVAQAVDLVAHLKNVHTVLAYSPKTASAMKDALLRLPGIGSIDTLRRIQQTSKEILEDGPEIRAKKAEMIQNGMLRPKYPARGMQKYFPFKLSHDLLQKWDEAARIIMSDFFDKQVEAGNITGTPEQIMLNKRNFVQQIGEYNDRLMSQMMANLKSSGFSPFVVAGTTFNRMGLKMLTGDPGFKAKDKTTNAKNRAQMLLTGYVAANVIPAMINLGTTGSIGGRPGTPIGAIDLGLPEDDKGKHTIVDIKQMLGYRRGERLLGLNELLAGLKAGADTNEIMGKMIMESKSSWAHPWMGPGPGFLWRAASGDKFDLRGSEHDYMGPRKFDGANQYLENLRVAVRDTNPLFYSIVGAIPGVSKYTPAYERQPSNIEIPFTDVKVPDPIVKIISGLGKTPVQTAGYTTVKTPATKLMDDLATQRFEVDPDTEESRSNAAQLLKEAREGAPSADIQRRLSEAVNSGAIKLNQVAKLQDNLNLSPTAVKFKYMVTDNVSDIIRVWERMTSKEKDESWVVMLSKVANMGDKISPTDADALRQIGITPESYKILATVAEAKQAKDLTKFNAEQSVKAGEKPDLSGLSKTDMKGVITKGTYTQDQKDFEGKTAAQQTFIYTNSPPEKQKEYRLILLKSFQNLVKKKAKTMEDIAVLKQLTSVLFPSASKTPPGKEAGQSSVAPQ